jgi:hypothetical protein
MKLSNGSIYKYNITDGLYYKWIAAGAGDEVHDEFDTTGISL